MTEMHIKKTLVYAYKRLTVVNLPKYLYVPELISRKEHDGVTSQEVRDVNFIQLIITTEGILRQS